MLVGNNFDPGNDLQAQSTVDLVGNATYPMMYMQFDDHGDALASNDELALRFRVDQALDKGAYSGYLWIGLDVDLDNDLDVYLMLVGKNGNSADVYSAGTGLNTSPSTSSITDAVSLPGLTLEIANVTAADEGANGDLDADSNTDTFVSALFLFQDFASRANAKPLTGGGGALIQSINGGAGLTMDTPIRFVAASAAQANSLNGDRGGYNGTGDDGKSYAQMGAFSPTITLGEPDAPVTPPVAPVIAITSAATTTDATPDISGTTDAPNGSTVTVTIDDQPYAATVTDGTWSVTVNTLVDGTYPVTASVTTVNGTGSASQSLVVDVPGPAIAITSAATTTDATPDISGTTDAPNGSTVTVTVDGQTYTTTGSGGAWSVTVTSTLVDGTYPVTASVTTANGTGSDSQDLTVDAPGPSITITSAGTTTDPTPTISGTTDAPDGSTVTVTIDDQIYTATVTDGAWSVTVNTLVDGTYPVTASVTTANGTGSDSQDLSVDAPGPTITITSAGTTTDPTPTISGTTDAPDGSTVTVTVDGRNYTTTVSGGNWAVTVNTLVDGTYSVTASVTTANGTGNDSQDLTVDTAGPAIAITSPTRTNDFTPTISGTTDAPDGSTVTVTIDGESYTTTASGGAWSVTVPDDDALPAGLYPVTASVDDIFGNTGTANQNLTMNAGPALTPIAARTVNERQVLTFTALATDPNLPDDTLTFQVTAAPTGATINAATGLVTWTAPSVSATRTYTLTVRVQDLGGLSDQETVTITVNETDPVPPALGGISGLIRSATGGLVADLGVQLIGPTGQTIGQTSTDDAGRYTFTGLVPGSYTVVTPSQANPLASGTVTVSAGQTAQLDLRLADRATLTLTADPAAIIGDGVSTSNLTASLIYKDGTPVTGSTILFETSAGRLAAARSVTGSSGRASVVLTAPVIQGVVPRTERATVIVRDVARGVFAEASVTITFLPASITGVVTDAATGQPVAGAIVEVLEDFDGDGVIDFTARAVTGSDGRYKIVVPRGNWAYQVHVTAPVKVGGRTVMMESTQTSQVGQLQGVGETIVANRKLSGQVFMMDNQADGPQEAGEVLKQSGRITGTIRSASGSGTEQSMTVNPDGSFEMEGLDPGEYILIFQVTAPDGTKLAGTRIRVNITQEGELVLQTPLIDPYGVVTDSQTGAPVEGVKMSLYWADTPLNQSLGRTKETLVNLPLLPDFAPNQNRVPQFTTSTGDYAWMVIPNGDYYIVAEKAGFVTYDSRTERRTVAPAPGEDSYVADGIIHVGTTIVRYDLTLSRAGSGTPGEPGNPGTGTPGTPGLPGSDPQVPPSPELGRHTRYIYGYPDGTFKPTNNITREEVAAILARIVAPGQQAQGLAPYPDVPAGHWANHYIALVTERGLMVGYPDGRFGPKDPVTRAEVATIAMRFKALNPTAGVSFPDIDGHWAQRIIHSVFTAGYVTGYPDGTFRPKQPMSRAEFVTVMNRLIDRGPLTEVPEPTWPDVPSWYWAFGNIEEASTLHEFERTGEKTERWKGYWQQ